MKQKLATILVTLAIFALLIPSAACDIRVSGDGFSDLLIGIDVDSDDLDFVRDFHDDDDDGIFDDDDDGFFDDDDDGIFDDDDDGFFDDFDDDDDGFF